MAIGTDDAAVQGYDREAALTRGGRGAKIAFEHFGGSWR